MSWLRHVLIDLAVTIVIFVAVLTGQTWARWVVWIYTPLMLLLKVASVAGNVGPSKSDVPDWFYHLTYGLSLAVLLYGAWYWEAAGWAAIWLLSAIHGARSKPKVRE